MKIDLICKNCNNKFVTDYKHRNKLFCGRTCYFDYAKKNELLGKEKDLSLREVRNCLQCDKPFEERKKTKRKLCSDECRILWNKNPYNTEQRLNKSKKTLQKKYGVDSIFNTETFKKNAKKIFKEKHGVESPMYLPHFVEKLKTSIREKHVVKLLPKLLEHNLILLDDYLANKDKNTSHSYNFKCIKCENIFTSTLLGSGKIPICRKCFPIIKNSKLEESVRDFLNVNNINHIDNSRKILGNREIDLFLPDFNIGIELNGNYFHSEIMGGKNKNYHLEKMVLASKKNIKLLQFFEDEILLKKEIVFSRLSSLLKLNKIIYARNCEIKEVNKLTSSEFLIKNHLQGSSIDKYRYGLFYNDQLVSIMTFGKKRKSLGNKNNTSDEFELVRFCNLINHNVVGGFSKLLSYFIKKNKPSKIITYADIRWSGLDPKTTVYFKNGFKYKNQTPPNYWYIKNGETLHRNHRFVFRKDVLIKEGFSKDKTEWEIMKEKGYDRIWDCGSMKFELIP